MTINHREDHNMISSSSHRQLQSLFFFFFIYPCLFVCSVIEFFSNVGNYNIHFDQHVNMQKWLNDLAYDVRIKLAMIVWLDEICEGVGILDIANHPFTGLFPILCNFLRRIFILFCLCYELYYVIFFLVMLYLFYIDISFYFAFINIYIM